MDFKTLEKVELHRHLEGSLRLSTLREVAATLHPRMPIKLEDFRQTALVLEPMKDLKSLLDRFDLHQSILHSPEVLERISFEACEDSYHEGIRLLELRYAPSFIRMNHPRLNYLSIHEAILRGIQRAKKAYGMQIGLIGILVRTEPLRVAEEVTEFILDQKNSFVGMDLASDEVGFDCRPFAPFFEKGRQAGLSITIHAGEANYPGAAQAVIDSIEILGAQRIGHGLQIIKDPRAIQVVREKGVVLELCPVSNELTSTGFTRKNYPILDLEKSGVRVTVNSDDPGLFGTNLCRDYEILNEGLGLVEADFIRFNQTAKEATFLKTKT